MRVAATRCHRRMTNREEVVLEWTGAESVPKKVGRHAPLRTKHNLFSLIFSFSELLLLLPIPSCSLPPFCALLHNHKSSSRKQLAFCPPPLLQAHLNDRNLDENQKVRLNYVHTGKEHKHNYIQVPSSLLVESHNDVVFRAFRGIGPKMSISRKQSI